MRQIWISKAGPPEVFVVKEATDPQPAAAEMRIRVEASGVNFADVMGRMGLYLTCLQFRSCPATRLQDASTHSARE
jgi:NADPH:quinone reductase-like Zn-dependent oxidoreductase